MPGTRLLRWFLAALTATTVLVVVATAVPPEKGLPVAALAGATYTLKTSPDDLPATVRVALAHELGQSDLYMAPAGAPFNATDVVSGPALPFHRLVAAAVSGKYVVIQFEEGGFAPRVGVVVVRRGFWRSHVLWSSGLSRAIRSPQELESAIRSGALWNARDR
jgi:hypothetical protein